MPGRFLLCVVAAPSPQYEGIDARQPLTPCTCSASSAPCWCGRSPRSTVLPVPSLLPGGRRSCRGSWRTVAIDLQDLRECGQSNGRASPSTGSCGFCSVLLSPQSSPGRGGWWVHPGEQLRLVDQYVGQRHPLHCPGSSPIFWWISDTELLKDLPDAVHSPIP